MTDGSGGSVRGLGVGVLPLNDRINLFFSILVTFIFLKNDTVSLDSILILYADPKNMFYTEPWWFFFLYLIHFLCATIIRPFNKIQKVLQGVILVATHT